MAHSDSLNSFIQAFNARGDETSVSQRWNRWKRSFELYLQAKNVTSSAQKKGYLLLCAGQDVQEIWETLPSAHPDFQAPAGSNAFSVCIDALTQYFSPAQIKQLPTETSLQYLTRLSALIINCDYDNNEKTLLDMLVQHTLSHEIRKELLKEGDSLTLSRAKEIARSLENSELQSKDMEAAETNSAAETIGAVRNAATASEARCFRCNSAKHMANDPDCPARTKTCNACLKKGHFQSVCQSSAASVSHTFARQRPPGEDGNYQRRQSAGCAACGHSAVPTANSTTSVRHTRGGARRSSKRDRVLRMLEEILSDDDDDEWYEASVEDKSEEEPPATQKGYMFHVYELNRLSEKLTIKVGGVPLDVIVDSGACVNVIDSKTWNELKKHNIEGVCVPDKKQLFPYGTTTPLPVLGRFDTSVDLKTKHVRISFYILDCEGSPLLGKQSAMDLGILLIQNPLHVVQDKSVSDTHDFKSALKLQFPEVFTGIGRLKNYEVKLKINPNVQPVVQPMRRYALHLLDAIKISLEKKLKQGIIELVDQPSAWVSPLVVGTKKSGELRLIVDAREPNKAIMRELHPIPSIEETTAKLHGAAYFSVLDCNEAFHQLTLNKDCREITTFSTPFGLMRYCTLIFVKNDEEEYVRWVVDTSTPTALTASELQILCEKDPLVNSIRGALRSDTWPANLRNFEYIKHELCTYGNLVLRGTRIFLPESVRHRVMCLAHEGHMGVVRTKQRLRSKVWWPSMDKDVEVFCRKCHGCQIVGQPDPPEPLSMTELSNRPWQYLALDYLGPLPNGQNILVLADYFSRFIEARLTASTTTERTVDILDDIFARFGFPDKLRVDRGPQSSRRRMSLANAGVDITGGRNEKTEEIIFHMRIYCSTNDNNVLSLQHQAHCHTTVSTLSLWIRQRFVLGRQKRRWFGGSRRRTGGLLLLLLLLGILLRRAARLWRCTGRVLRRLSRLRR
ncbi:hypothetical protein B566_EDAN015997, partial [Ephemera danica]